jgi:rhodanese-related sulfurtransferase
MKSFLKGLIVLAITIAAALPVFAQDDTAKKMNDVLMKGLEEGHWQVTADEVYMWIKTEQKDFLIVDVRPNPEEYKTGHIPGSLHIPYNEILKPENLKKLPPDKKIILVCVTGQVQNLPIVPLRALGYDAYTMSFGHAAWIKNYRGGEVMKKAIEKTAIKNYPVEK